MHTPQPSDMSPRPDTPNGRGGAHRAPKPRTRGFIAAIAIVGVFAGASVGLALAELPGMSVPDSTSRAPVDLSSSSSPTATREPGTLESSKDAGVEDPEPAEPTTESGSDDDPVDDVVDPLVEMALEAVQLTNDVREQNGCPSVDENSNLTDASTGHSEDMAVNGYFDHVSQDGRDFVDRAVNAGYDSPISENIAYGQNSAQAALDAWMNSEGHRDNILNCDAKSVGLGVGEADDGTLYWTQMFGSA
ncbi:MAG: CAP domain-containing protein [Stackebrandtia sp.]